MTNDLAFIFDMDGVIIDSTSLHVDVWARYLAQFGIVVPDLERTMLGKHNDALVRQFFGNPELSDRETFEHGARKEALYREMVTDIFESKLVPGVREFIRESTGFPMGVATNAEPANVDFVLDRSGLRPFLQAVVSGDQVERPKPAPDIYLKAAQLLATEPSCCVVFEDSLTGVAAARSAGMRVVGLTTTLHEFNDVDLTIRDFSDDLLRAWLQKLRVCV